MLRGAARAAAEERAHSPQGLRDRALDGAGVARGARSGAQGQLEFSGKPAVAEGRGGGRGSAGGLKILAWSDGASRGNPGPASIGVVLNDADGKPLDRIARRLGRRTNNHAEYEAVRQALERALELGATEVVLHADSELVVRQLSGVYRVKNAELKPLFDAVKALEAKIGRVSYTHVRREQNREADELANLALDGGE